MRHAPAFTFGLFIAATAHAADPAAAARSVLRRLLPDHAGHFAFEPIDREDGCDVFELESRPGRPGGRDAIILRGSSGVAMCSALNAYLEQYCHCQISYLGTQLKLPDPLPRVEPKLRRVSPHRYRYWFNYCAFSYSLAFWDWPQWERFIDWMALHGINTPLAVTGQEATWRAVGRRFGLTDAQIAEFLPGPAYLPFGWMGCLDGWGGPLPQAWIDQHEELQRKILARERELGMTPVLQGFTGHLPAAMKEKFPAAKFREVKWLRFEPTTFVDPSDPLFITVGKAFLEEQTRQFGTDHLYASDTFIEMMPPSDDPAFLADMGRAVYGAMTAADPDAIWLMQGWIFINNAKFWQPPQAKALFNAVPDGRLILIDMGRDTFLATESFYGKPWIWTTIRNYGNVVELGDNLGDIIARSQRALTSSQRGRLCGSGGIMEGLGFDPPVFELVADLNWRDDITQVEPWLMNFIHQRYGRQSPRMQSAYRRLLATVYSTGGGDGIICMRPRLTPSRRGREPVKYDNAELAAAAREMLEAADEFRDVDTYRYDVVNVTRQALVNAARPLYDEIVEAHAAKDPARLTAAGTQLIELINDIDRLLATRGEFLLGAWIADARRWATNPAEERLYEWNARNQVTLWGPADSNLHGYARKHWSGLLADYYGPRWKLFLRRLDEALAAGREFDGGAFEKECQAFDDRWSHAANPFPAQPAGDPVTVSQQLLVKHAAVLSSRPGP